MGRLRSKDFIEQRLTTANSRQQVVRALYTGCVAVLACLHMSEYQERHDLAKLTGTAPGYVGYDEGGKLTNGAKRAQVILLDEIEKAHPDIQKAVLLPMLDEGELTDNSGEKVSVAQKVVILTSNLGAAGAHSDEQTILAAAQRFFLPEVWARIAHKLVFGPLTAENALEIADILLGELTERMREEHRIELLFAEGLREAIVASGFDSNDGARSLRPVITNTVEHALTHALLESELHDGDHVIVLLTPHRELHGHTHREPDGRASLSGYHATLNVAVA